MTDTEQNRLIAEKVMRWKEDEIGFYEEYQSRGSRQTHFTSSLDLCHKYILPKVAKDGKKDAFLIALIAPMEVKTSERFFGVGTFKFLVETTPSRIVTATLKTYGLEK